MLFTQVTLEGIATGAVTLAFRRWRGARVRPGTTLRTSVGVVGITGINAIDPEDITVDDAQMAGFATLPALLAQVGRTEDGQLYRIGLRFEGDDPRVALRQRGELSDDERDALLHRLAGMGARSPGGAWAIAVLRLIDEHPAIRAATLARVIGMDTLPFKARVRQLKELGLTESLEIGYRLSPRGRAVLRLLDERTRS